MSGGLNEMHSLLQAPNTFHPRLLAQRLPAPCQVHVCEHLVCSCDLGFGGSGGVVFLKGVCHRVEAYRASSLTLLAVLSTSALVVEEVSPQLPVPSAMPMVHHHRLIPLEP